MKHMSRKLCGLSFGAMSSMLRSYCLFAVLLEIILTPNYLSQRVLELHYVSIDDTYVHMCES